MPGSAISSPATRLHDQVRVGWRANLRGVERGEAEPIHDAGGGEGMRAGRALAAAWTSTFQIRFAREGTHRACLWNRAPVIARLATLGTRGLHFMTRIKTSFLALATTVAVLAAPPAGFAQEPPLATSGN